ARPRLLATLAESERTCVLEAASADIASICTGGSRSLGTVRVSSGLTATFTEDAYAGTFEARVGFPGLPGDMASVACTDLKWRAFGRGLLARSQAAASQGERRILHLGG